MSIRKKDVYDYLDTHPVSKYEGDFESLLEMLHYVYTTCNPVDSEKIREDFCQLGGLLQGLSFESENIVFSAVCDLCCQHEQVAFYYGLAAGMHLMTEINALP